ncbi:MAG: HEPN domain-containing protein [Hormoscilla sp. GM102CHS1]|nr:HEPN domain-containing protein [Hormoscilla sp. GM102CHS1]
MSFDWSQYLHLARELAEKTTDEAKMRSAISRAYYAAFIKARNYLQEWEGLTIPTQNTHQYVIDQFRNSEEQVRKNIGNRLNRLRLYRNQSDYDNTFPDLANKTRESLTLGRRIISGLGNL